MERRIDVIHDQLLQLFKSKRPDQHHLAISNLSDKSGWENDVFPFILHYEEEAEKKNEPLLLKLYRGNSGTKKAIGEFYSLQELALASYPVPSVLFIGLEHIPFGKPYVVMEQVSGRLLGDVLRAAPESEQEALIEIFCRLFVELHQIHWEPFVIDATNYQPEHLIQRTLEEKCLLIDKHCPGKFGPIIAWLLERCAQIQCERLSVIHWDYHIDNILLSDDNTVCVIDWTQAEVSDYRFDLAWTLLLSETFKDSQFRERILQRYEYYAGERIFQLEFFEVAICLKRLLEMLLHARNAGGTFATPAIQRQYILSIQAAQALLKARTGITLTDWADL